MMMGMFESLMKKTLFTNRSSSTIRFGNVVFDFNANTLIVDHKPLHLELKQSLVLVKLLAESPRIVSKDELLEFGWPAAATGDDVLAVAISHLRKSLGDSVRSPKFIKTVAGQGYQWVTPLRSKSRLVAQGYVYGDAPAENTSTHGRRTVFFTIVLIAFALSSAFLLRPDPLAEAANLLQSEDSSDWPEALALYEDAYATGNDSVEVLIGMVDAQSQILQGQPRYLYQARQEINAWLEQALEVSPKDPRIHFRLARLEFLVAWNWEAAYQHIQKAIELEPEQADFHLFFSYLQLALGDFDAATASLEKAREIDPRHYAREMAAWIYNMQRNYDQARLELERLVEIRPGTLNYHVSAQSVLENSGDHDESFHHLLKTLELAGYDQADLDEADQVYQQMGLGGVYHWLLVDRKETRNIGQYQPPLAHARYAIQSGDLDAAMGWLEDALEARQYELLWINVDPKYDPLRGDPRFDSLVKTIGLPPLKNS